MKKVKVICLHCEYSYTIQLANIAICPRCNYKMKVCVLGYRITNYIRDKLSTWLHNRRNKKLKKYKAKLERLGYAVTINSNQIKIKKRRKRKR